MNNTIRIKNELPELLEAVCEHPKCPEWLRFAIWDAFAEHNTQTSFKADHWRAVLNNPDLVMEDRREIGMCQYPYCDRDMEVMRYCVDHAELVLERAKAKEGKAAAI
jgi:hypothetical protein